MTFKDKIDEKFYKYDRHPIGRTVGELKKILSELPDELPIDPNTCKIVVFNVNSDDIRIEFMEEHF